MPHYDPFIVSSIGAIPYLYGRAENWPICLPAVAEDIENQANSSIDRGDYHDHIGEIWGTSAPYLDPNGCSLVTGRNLGITFDTVGTFTATDDWNDPLYSMPGILIPNQTAGATAAELIQHNTDTVLQQYKIVLRRGVPPVSSGPTSANCYLRMQFCYGSTTDYQLVFDYSRPVRLQVSYDTGSTWADITSAKKLPLSEDLFHMFNDCIPIRTKHDQDKGVFCLYLGTGIALMHKPPTVTIGVSPLSTVQGRIRITESNGWMSLYMAQVYHKDTLINKNFTVPPPQNASMAFVVGNALTKDNQTFTGTISNDGSGNFSMSANVSKADDSGMGLGSSQPPRFTDVTAVVPAYWLTSVIGGVNPTTVAHPKTMRVDETETWNENERTGSFSGTLFINNYTGQYNGVVGKQACNIRASIDGGTTLWDRVTGTSGASDNGIGLENPMSGVNLVRVPLYDKSDMMGNGQPPVCLGYEHMFDGHCLWSVVRYLTEKGNIHPSTLLLPDSTSGLPDIPSIPGSGALLGGIYYPPNAPTIGPGTNGYAPYGPADTICPYPILGRGVGDTPRYVFGRSMTPWQCLQRLVMEESYEYIDPITSAVTWIPYMMYFDKLGYFHFEPYHPALLTPVCGFSSNAPLAASLYPNIVVGGITIPITWYPMEGFTVNSSVSQVRSDITFQSLDALTNEVLQAHLDMPPSAKELIGHASNWIEGSGRWGEQSTLEDLVTTAAAQASIPSDVASGDIPFLPFLHAGQRVRIMHPETGNVPIDFYITQLSSSYGHASLYGQDGKQMNRAQFFARAIVNFL